jgi:diaminohydroxyphosphoribosylaminopyrimidine deaminase/5-amino-6-(5-phosphoribosylamino)uracil reductase
VDEGVLEQECRQLNQAFIKRVTTGLPYVTLKSAATLDGRIATRSGDSKWISNERSRRFAHQMRCSLDAILVGIETVLADDPMLTARIRQKPPCRQPLRIVLDSRLRIPASSLLAQTAKEVPVWVACGLEASREKEAELTALGLQVIRLPDSHGVLSLRPLLQELGRKLVNSLLVEGGSRVLGSFLNSKLADDFHFFYGPKILGDSSGIPMISGDSKQRMADSLAVHHLKVKRFGGDVLLSGRFHEDLY